ncbi:MAG TPA: ABC transporter permease [Candidatus Paceibacterota bacterium]|nr:ABC transporter permease [Candidatus Paceibacterota bacterium]
MTPLSLRIGWFLALRALRRASPWTTGLIIFVMVLTFLNLVVVSGILVGLIQGSINAWRTEFTSDVIISTLDDKKYIENSPNLIALVRELPEVESVSPRYSEGATLEANYKTRKDTDKPNIAAAQIMGIDPLAEDAVTDLGSKIMEGSYLAPGDYDQIILGYYLLSQYVPVDDPNLAALTNVRVGTKIRIAVGSVTREVTVKGIIRSKVDALTRNAFMIDSQFRNMIGRDDGNVDQIVVRLKPGTDPIAVREALKLRGVDSNAKVQTYADAQPQFLKDIVNTFNILGSAFGSIGLIVASITIFIVVFINALTRRKYIGILKGIGIRGHAIQISYIFQSIFYALCGSAIGLILLYGLLVPFFLSHPINFPFSDGILVAPLNSTLFRVGLLVLSTIIAGYIPAWMIIRKNTLDSILGRA